MHFGGPSIDEADSVEDKDDEIDICKTKGWDTTQGFMEFHWKPRPSPEGSLENSPRKNVCKMIRRFDDGLLLFIYELKRAAWRVLSESGLLVYETSELTLSFGPLP